MGLFENVNPALFKPLAGRYRDLFACLLDIIWCRCKSSKDYSIEKDELTELAERYFEGLQITMDLSEEDDESGEPVQVELSGEPHTQALWSVNRLRNTGWLADLEGKYGEAPRTAVVPVVVPMLQAFNEILRPQTVTYSGKLFKASQLFRTLGQEPGPYENILKEVSSSMDELNHALRNLNASIGKYIEKMTSHKNPQQVLELFDEYEEKIVVAAYHRFKTSENLFRYRGELEDALDACEDVYLEPLIRDYCRVEQVERDQALPDVLHLIQKVRGDLEVMEELIADIDQNHITYRRRAVQRAEFTLLSDSSVQGTINDLLKYYEQDIKTNGGWDDPDDSPLSTRWKLYPVGVLGENFLKTPAMPRRKTQIEPLALPEDLSEEELLAAQKQLLAYAASAVTQENVNRFAGQLLQAGDGPVRASEIAARQPDEFAKIIALHTYSESLSRGYDIELGTEWVRCGKFRFQEFELKKKV